MPAGGDKEEVTERQKAEALFLANLEWVEQSVETLCRRYGLDGDEVDDLVSWVKFRLIEDDYAALRKFRGDSSIRTYLVVVAAALFRDYRASNWGRWRPSAAALRGGPLAVRLETLVYRDGCTLDQAGRILRDSGATDLPDRSLAALLAQLPVRGPLRPYEAGEAPLKRVLSNASAEESVVTEEAEHARHQVFAALNRALLRLPDEDHRILRLHFWDCLSPAEVARSLCLPQKPLYRRIERILHRVRRELTEDGVEPQQLHEFVGELPK